jgi:uncharacterized protein (TIGR00251 family)
MNGSVDLVEREGAVVFQVTVQPRAAKSEVVGGYGGALKLRIAAPPVDGKANHECERFLSELLQVPRSAVSILKGVSSKRKTVRVSRVSADQVRRALSAGTRG